MDEAVRWTNSSMYTMGLHDSARGNRKDIKQSYCMSHIYCFLSYVPQLLRGYHMFFIFNKNFVRFEIFTAVTMKNAVIWDIKIQFLPHKKKNIIFYRVQPVNAMYDLSFSRRWLKISAVWELTSYGSVRIDVS
jgi:hypothetical protein